MTVAKYCFFGLFLLAGLTAQSQEIQWMSWEEASIANDKQPRKIFVDVYTDWCGWCKKMDATTFKDPAVAGLMQKDFYAVKLNAEQKDAIEWRDVKFEWFPGGRSGVHKLAYELLDGKLSYPSFVILDEEYKRIMISPGFKTGEDIIKELTFASGEHYKTMSWDAYKTRF